MKRNKDWFANWFAQKYDLLYPHRSVEQAERQVRFLFETNRIPQGGHFLDLGCGAGRHLQFLQKFGNAIGMDLSSYLLEQAREKHLRVVRGDLRKLPFASEASDGVFSFFTSFGYLEDRNQDFEVLKEMTRCLKPGGALYLDLMNPAVLLQNLPRKDETVLANGARVIQDRYIEKDRVIKKIHWYEKGESQIFYEKVRVYHLEEIESFAENLNLKLISVFGDERGAEFSDNSPRMSFLFSKG